MSSGTGVAYNVPSAGALVNWRLVRTSVRSRIVDRRLAVSKVVMRAAGRAVIPRLRPIDSEMTRQSEAAGASPSSSSEPSGSSSSSDAPLLKNSISSEALRRRGGASFMDPCPRMALKTR
jgi:hypothetical protein